MNSIAIVGLVGIAVVIAIFNSFFLKLVAGRYSYMRIDKPPGDVIYERPNSPLRYLLNGLFAPLLFVGFILLLGDRYILGTSANPLIFLLHVATIVLIWDFLYYWGHRTFHTPALMRWIHGRHHQIHYPTAFDGLYVDPLDNFVAQFFFFVAVVVIGPVGVDAFLAAAFLHMFINSVNHWGVKFSSGPMRIFNYWTRSHDHHHGKNIRSNFGAITPIWDRLFGSYEAYR